MHLKTEHFLRSFIYHGTSLKHGYGHPVLLMIGLWYMLIFKLIYLSMIANAYIPIQ